jgi:hypothetical protein
MKVKTEFTRQFWDATFCPNATARMEQCEPNESKPADKQANKTDFPID